jgi:hypothetical protein
MNDTVLPPFFKKSPSKNTIHWTNDVWRKDLIVLKEHLAELMFMVDSKTYFDDILQTRVEYTKAEKDGIMLDMMVTSSKIIEIEKGVKNFFTKTIGI